LGDRLFGTDGVRGVANRDLTPDLAMGLGRAAAEPLTVGPVLVGRDTRRSGAMLSAAFQAGVQSVGIDTVDVGVLPSGGIARLVADSDAVMGAVITASHNPAPDNGIKLLDGSGFKLSDAAEDAIAARLEDARPWKAPTGHEVGMQFPRADALDRYLELLTDGFAYSLRGISVTLDCANGAAYKAAPALFDRLGADAESMATTPDGTNINDGVGAPATGALVRAAAGRVGLAFDGDADRLIAVDEEGRVADGDVLMAIIAHHLHERGRLAHDTVVATVMSNLGFRKALTGLGIAVAETKVGDRYVLAAMRELGATLGGEQSGHVIFLDQAPTGDGLLTALRLMEVMAATGKPLVELRQIMTTYPQVLRNVRVADTTALNDAEAVWDEIARVEEDLGTEGRVLVRASGTEPVIRVMVEAPDDDTARDSVDRICDVVRAELG
jgi:phosphoglucosamine mutase